MKRNPTRRLFFALVSQYHSAGKRTVVSCQLGNKAMSTIIGRVSHDRVSTTPSVSTNGLSPTSRASPAAAMSPCAAVMTECNSRSNWVWSREQVKAGYEQKSRDAPARTTGDDADLRGSALKNGHHVLSNSFASSTCRWAFMYLPSGARLFECAGYII